MDRNLEKEHIDRINLGEVAKSGLKSEFWTRVVKPVIDSMLTGLVDIRDVKKSLLTSNKKAEIEVLGRALAAEYLEKIEVLVDGMIIDADLSRKTLEKHKQSNELYKENT